MIKLKIVDGLYCPVPFCDECGKEIEGADKHDRGAYIFLMPQSEQQEGAVLDFAFVHTSDAKGCMDRWERHHHAAKYGKTSRGWMPLEWLAVYMFNSPGFHCGLHEKWRIVEGEIRSGS